MQIKKLMEVRGLKGRLIYLPLICMIFLHMPIVFAATKAGVSRELISAGTQKDITGIGVKTDEVSDVNIIEAEYDSMHLDNMGLSKTAFSYAIQGFKYLLEKDRISNNNIISIVDFSQPSSRKRLFVIDLDNLKVLYNTYVAHGVNSGKEYANQFSNIPESNKSSLGFYETKSTYLGANGYSLRLAGLERGINDNAEKRDIVIHGAGYVDESLIRSQGYIGRSWGCPALPEKLHRPIINKIKNGSCLFIYSANNAYLKKSKIINR